MNVLVTGATGFIGSALFDSVAMNSRFQVSGTSRKRQSKECQREINRVGELGPDTDWGQVLNGVNVIIHTAARVHVMKEHSNDPLSIFRKINVSGTLHLAKKAVEAGVKRFVFISSVKVNGEETKLGKSFSENMEVSPQDAYSLSKREAERGLFKISRLSGMELVVIRPPLVYGPGVNANFMLMMSWVNMGIPLPFGAIHNRRSLVALDNLIDLIITCIDHPLAANHIFFVSDGNDISTTELLENLGKNGSKPVHLIPVPQKIIELGLSMIGREDLRQRLCGSLQVDITKAKKLLGWQPPVRRNHALKRTMHSFMEYR